MPTPFVWTFIIAVTAGIVAVLGALVYSFYTFITDDKASIIGKALMSFIALCIGLALLTGLAFVLTEGLIPLL